MAPSESGMVWADAPDPLKIPPELPTEMSWWFFDEPEKSAPDISGKQGGTAGLLNPVPYKDGIFIFMWGEDD